MDKAEDRATAALAEPPQQLRDGGHAPHLAAAAIAQPAAAAPPTADDQTQDNAAIGHGLDAKLQVGQCGPPAPPLCSR